jgi:hypothetical protein
MTSKADDRYDKALHRELGRAREYATETRIGHQESAALTNRHIEGLAKVLRPLVKRALQEETQLATTSKEWVGEARALASWLAHTTERADVHDQAAAKVPAGAGAWVSGIWASVTSLFRVQHSVEAQGRRVDSASAALSMSTESARQDEQRLAAELEQELLKTHRLDPSDAEIEEHATDLARLLISNWFAILEDAASERPHQLIELAYRGLPLTAAPNALTEGCEAFAPPVEQSFAALAEYQKQLVKPGSSVALSPLVHLHLAESGQWYAFVPENARLLTELRTRKPVQRPLEDAVTRFADVFSPVAIGRALQLHGGLAIDAHSMMRYSVGAATLIQRHRHPNEGQRRDFAQLIHASEPAEGFERLTELLVRDLAYVSRQDAVRSDLEAARQEAVAIEEHADMLVGDLYMAALPSAAALLSVDQTDPVEVPVDFEAFSAQERVIVAATATIVSNVLDAPQANAQMGSNLRALMAPGQEPSGFGLLGC